jgi:chondroitin AC lyase
MTLFNKTKRMCRHTIRSYIILFILLISSNYTYPSDSINQLKKNFIERCIGNYPQNHINDSILSEIPSDEENGDQVVREVYQHRMYSEEFYRQLIERQNSNGSWPDINYSDTKSSNWEPIIHANRTFILAQAYLNPRSPFYKSSDFSKAIHSALNFYHLTAPVCSNWWYNEIGIPKTLGPVYLMIEKELTEKERNDAISIVLNRSTFKMTGQNKVWLAGNIFIKALLTNDLSLAWQAHDTIVSELKTGNFEGIQPDYSFHQHGSQLQFGNYGMAFITTMCSWALLFHSTPLEYTKEQLLLLQSLLNEGYKWIFHNGYLDVNALGRQFSKNIQQLKSLAVCYSLTEIALANSSNKDLYLQLANNIQQSTSCSSSCNKHFWRSDYTVHQSKSWMATTRMSSTRVIGTESGNGDNLQGNYLADGATYLYIKGDEYKDIFPVWNWRKIPGITSVQSNEPLTPLTWQGYHNHSDYSGGVTNSEIGIAATILKHDGLTAYKATFYLNDMIVFLGSGITVENGNQAITTINQCLSNEKIYYQNDSLSVYELKDSICSDHVQGIYHNRIGYYFNKPSYISVKNGYQTGSWSKVMSMYHYQEIQKKVFLLQINHLNETDGYNYTIIPDISSEELWNFKPDQHYRIIENSKDLQAISCNDVHKTLACFYKNGWLKTSDGTIIEMKDGGMLIMEETPVGKIISLSDPTQTKSSMEIIINGLSHHVELPQQGDKGETVTLTLYK